MSEVNNVVIPFQHPFMLTLCGPSQSGKTHWIHKLIKFIDMMITPAINKINFLYSTYQPKYDELKQTVEKRKDDLKIVFIDCNKGIPHLSEIQNKPYENTLVVLDDLMIIAANKENIEKLDNFSCCNVHHNNISVIFVCQNLMYGNGKLRNSRVNSQYIVMFKNLADCRNMNTIINNKKIKLSANVLKEINSQPYGYLLFDNCVKSHDNTRVRTNIFPDEKTIIYDV